ncbi:MAG: tetratricopeptide repeat protein [Hyphomicrobiales bacterium]|nr:tetratricopeptide repeat protein [Hyphomicrobiales bacterium]
MWTSVGRVVVVAAACLLVVSGCETSTKLSGLFNGQRDDDTTATGSVESVGNPGAVVVAPDPVVNAANPRLAGQDPYDDLNLGKKYFRSANFGLAEKHFRRAVELHPGDAEAWLGLAASYDRLKRFDLADRAYAQAAALVGDTPEIMNNRGFSYILRGDYRRARRTLLAAQARAPENPYIRNNLELLEKTQRRGKAIN